MTFDFGAYLADVSKLQSQLAELYGIDAAIDYILDMGKTAALGTAGSMSRGSSGAGVSTSNTTFHMGTTYPFDYFFQYLGSSQEFPTMHTQVTSLLSSGDAYVAADIESFSSNTEYLILPTSPTLEQLARDLASQVNDPLTTGVSDDFGYLDQTLTDWRGEAADNFSEFFYHQFGQMAHNQGWLAGSLSSLVVGCKAIVDLGQNSLQGLVSAMLKAVDEQLKQRKTDNESTGANAAEFLSLLAFCAGVFALVDFPVEGVAEAFELSEGGLHYAESGVPESDGEKLEVKAQTAKDLLGQLSQHTSTIVSNYHSNFETLNSQKVTQLSANVEKIVAAKLLYPPKVELAGGSVPPGDFYNIQ